MAPTINTIKLVATAIATFASTDKFIIFPSIMAAIRMTAFLNNLLFSSLRISARLWTPRAEEEKRRRRGDQREVTNALLCRLLRQKRTENASVQRMQH
jgi:hypothetical protein